MAHEGILTRIWRRHRLELLLGFSLLLPFVAPSGAWLSGILDTGLLVLPRAAAADTSEPGDEWRDAYYRALQKVGELEARLLAVATSENLKMRDPAFWRRKPVRIEAEVIARDASPWRGSVTISAGKDDGVAAGQAVVVGEALIGVVHEVRALTARVRLLGDAGQRVWSEILTADGPREGLVAGSGGDLSMKHVAAGAGRAGDPVFTGGGTVGIPRGLLVGSLLRIEDENRDGLAEVDVRPAVDPRDLRIVNVLARPE
ncbi:MAG: rod shape-determining protein MreC [Planctomycetota bacterium]